MLRKFLVAGSRGDGREEGFPLKEPSYGTLDPELAALPRIDMSKEAAERERLDTNEISEGIKSAMARGDVGFLASELKSMDLQRRWEAAYALGNLEKGRSRARLILDDYHSRLPVMGRTSMDGGYMLQVIDGEIERSRVALRDRARWEMAGLWGLVALCLLVGWLVFSFFKSRSVRG